MKLLEDKVAIVTGASSGIGGTIALLFAAQGAAVVLGGRREDALAGLGAPGIRANALLPGGTDIPGGSDAQKKWAAGLQATKRIAPPAEVANAALFLASPLASFVAGAALCADGGNAAVE